MEGKDAASILVPPEEQPVKPGRSAGAQEEKKYKENCAGKRLFPPPSGLRNKRKRRGEAKQAGKGVTNPVWTAVKSSGDSLSNYPTRKPGTRGVVALRRWGWPNEGRAVRGLTGESATTVGAK